MNDLRGGAAGAGAGPVPGAGTRPAPAPSSPDTGTLYVRFRGRDGIGVPEEVYDRLLALLGQFTPVVQALPPDAALADVRGALRYFGRDAAGIADLIRVRALAWHDVDCAIGISVNPLLARMAGQSAAPGEVRIVPGDPGTVADFLDRRPAAALDGVGAATARTLCSYGLDSVGRIAAAPPATLQRILGAKTGRKVYERARGLDPSPVTPNPAARSMGGEHRFPHDELDAERRRRALLRIADDLGTRLRGSGQAARALTLTVRYADRTTTTRTRTVAEPTAQTPALAATAYALHDALGLQRARVRAVSLRAENLIAADSVGLQLTFEQLDQRTAGYRRLEPVLDRVNSRWPGAVGPAAAVGL